MRLSKLCCCTFLDPTMDPDSMKQLERKPEAQQLKKPKDSAEVRKINWNQLMTEEMLFSYNSPPREIKSAITIDKNEKNAKPVSFKEFLEQETEHRNAIIEK